MRYNGRVVWIWCWLGVLVASCGQSTLPSPTSQTLPATLLGLTRLPNSPTPPLKLLRTATARAASMVAITLAPTPLPLSIRTPDCYETPVGGLWCLGQVHNNLSVAIERVVVRVYLVTSDGTALAEQETSIARTALMPGESSPYGVLFESVPASSAGPVVALISAIEARDLSSRLLPITVKEVHTDLQNATYHVTGALVNQNPAPIQGLTLTVTLFDAAGRVTGFRQWRWPPDQILATEATLPFAVDITPQGRGTLRVETVADGRPA